MGQAASSTALCSDCAGLVSRSRLMHEPHLYLVLDKRNPSASSYHCLVCEAKITFELQDSWPQWETGDGPTCQPAP
jgi:hypothetical protein